jgi:uncharacterized OB-fold protein
MPERDFNHNSFQTYLGEHKLMGSRCASCHALYVPPRPLCSICFGETMTWEEMGGNGKLRAFTVVHIATSAMIEAGYGRENPHVSGIVKLAEGPSVSAQILGADAAHPEQLAVGTPLSAAFIERDEGEEVRTYLAFKVKRDQ